MTVLILHWVRMMGYSYMVTGRSSEGRQGYWTVWGSLTRRTRRQLWRDRLRRIEFSQLERGPVLGVGGFGRVELVTIRHKSENRSFALKTIKKSALKDPESRRQSVTEKELLAEVDSEFVIKLYRTFQTADHLHLLLELCQGGELWSLVRKDGHMEDDRASFYMACVVEGLDYLHSRDIIYRDLKPENCLLANNGYIKLVDLGLAKRLKAHRRTYSFCGTAEYVPPEVILQTGHGPEADLWSLGILIYELVEGRPPFMGETSNDTYGYILQGMEYAHFPNHVTVKARNIILSLCRRELSERLGAGDGGWDQVRGHKWFQNINWKDLRQQKFTAPFLPEIRNEQDTHLFESTCGGEESSHTSGYVSEGDRKGDSSQGCQVGHIDGWDNI